MGKPSGPPVLQDLGQVGPRGADGKENRFSFHEQVPLHMDKQGKTSFIVRKKLSPYKVVLSFAMQASDTQG